ncbi:ABC transporter substrate-binding protein [Mesorhizobium sp. ANAO-SY3R2]|uniref:ABC transporter substrate-binding protein n=1 Tax=Mesorhizobium sp. ANAO-SY3R2 TaxID=3166644 RepID=UPI00366D1241
MTDSRSSYKEWLEKYAAEFKKQRPDVEINIVQMAPADAYLKWPAAVAAGNAPDITWMFVAFAPWLHEMPGGGFVPMNDVMEDLGVDKFTDTSKAAWRLGDQYLCAPVSRQTSYLFWRKDLFKAAGLEPPRTWDDVVAAAKTLTVPEKGEFGIAMAGKSDFQIRQIWETILYSNGGDLIDSTGKVVADSPESVRATEIYRELFGSSPPGSLANAYVEINRIFGQGATAMVVSLPVVLTQLLQGDPSLAGQVGAVIPSDNGGTDTMQNYRGWCVFKTSKHPEIAKDFVKMLFSTDAYADHLEAAQLSSMPVYDDKVAIERFFTTNKTAQAFPEALRYVLDHDSGYYSGINRLGPNPKAGQLNNEGVIERHLNRFLVEKGDAAATVKAIASDIERVMGK